MKHHLSYKQHSPPQQPMSTDTPGQPANTDGYSISYDLKTKQEKERCVPVREHQLRAEVCVRVCAKICSRTSIQTTFVFVSAKPLSWWCERTDTAMMSSPPT